MTRMRHSSSQAALGYRHATDDAECGMADGIDTATKAATPPAIARDPATPMRMNAGWPDAPAGATLYQ